MFSATRLQMVGGGEITDSAGGGSLSLSLIRPWMPGIIEGVEVGDEVSRAGWTAQGELTGDHVGSPWR